MAFQCSQFSFSKNPYWELFFVGHIDKGVDGKPPCGCVERRGRLGRK